MHPPLAKHKHKACIEAIDALHECHKEHSISKFWGACNEFKHALDECLKQEKIPIRKKALEEARASRQRWEEVKQERGEQGK